MMLTYNLITDHERSADEYYNIGDQDYQKMLTLL